MKKIELNILIFILLEALFLLYGTKINIINIILGTILGIILIIIFSKFKKNNIIKTILLIITILLLIISVNNTTSFIINNLLNNYSYFIITLAILIISYLLIKNGYHPYIKSIQIISYFFILIKLISFLLVIPNININNFNHSLLSELDININLLYTGLIIFYIHQSIYYLTNHIINKKIYLISSLNPILIKIISIIVIGRTLFYLYNYPYINVLKKIKYLDFIERMEGILSFEYLFSFIILISFCLLLIKSLIKKEKISDI